MASDIQRLSVKEKIGYSLGDSAANFIFQTMMILQMSFYTDTFGISAAEAGWLLLVARVWDAFFDPMMGVIADRTKSRWGKFRPWILWTAIPFGIMGFLTFSTPALGHTGKLIYAYVTYIVLMTVYSANNLPYSALSGVMTGDVVERTSLSSYRFTFAMLAALAIQGMALPMVKYFGKGDNALGYQWTMGIFCTLAVVFFVITFLATKERIKPDPSQKTSIMQDFADLLRNGPWITMFLLTIAIFITLAMRGGDMIYFFKYYMDPAVMTSLLDKIGLAGAERDADTIAGRVFSLFNVCGLVTTLIGIGFSKSLAMRYGKRNVFIVGLTLTTVLWVFFIFIPPAGVLAAIILQAVSQLAYGVTVPLLWAMMGDVADYSEWKTGRRATGVVFAAIVFGLKAGLGFGGAIGGWILAHYGYIANVQQTERALLGIRLTASIFPAIPFAIGVVLLFFYAINRSIEFKMQDELTARRKQYAAAQS
ncbi:MAG: MFS transporter [Planctomycetaceae bacterium]|nr:MFS transporter [Planctomycetaceae bacterium]